MKINSRLKKIEREIKKQNEIPVTERLVPIVSQDVQDLLGGGNAEEENERNIQTQLAELRTKYGEWVSREDLAFCEVAFADDGKFPDKTEQ